MRPFKNVVILSNALMILICVIDITELLFTLSPLILAKYKYSSLHLKHQSLLLLLTFTTTYVKLLI